VPFDNSVAHQAMIIFRNISFAVALCINPECREVWLFRANIDFILQRKMAAN
jgi:Zn-finger nucleic acid-binding protein